MPDENKPVDTPKDSRDAAFRSLRGALKDVYAKFGGGEAYLRWRREGWDRTVDDEQPPK